MALPDVDEALSAAECRRGQKLKLLAWIETQPEDVQAWIWSVFDKGYIRGTVDCATAWRVVQKHIPNTPQIAHQSMKRGVDAHFAERR